MPRPDKPPIGLAVSRVAKALNRAFEDVLAGAGGSQPVWLILVALRARPDSTQRQLAQVLSIREATLTHHLNGMERDGLVARRRDPENRRVHQVVVTDDGDAMFRRLRSAAVAFDRQLRAGIDDDRLTVVAETLQQLAINAAG
ncbi:MAG TPA: MarR family winged helix-turn-helix transcriptional regulator [Pseudonocardiaceae bacterium]|jgi:MarR family transcriptional regulator for hemolysin|nr:MarR family winged helix-turn-helix transcriptional regulator [Pseudonocardiaceae bacterium]